MSTLHHVQRGTAAFSDAMERLFGRNAPAIQNCKGRIDRGWLNAHKPGFQHLFWAEPANGDGRKVDGFLCASEKTVDGQRCLYIDLVCSANYKGKALIRMAEDYARSRAGIKLVALRAAWSSLLKYYENLGYHRSANACSAEGRGDRQLKRVLDEDAACFHGRCMREGYGEGWWMSKCVG